MRRVTLRRGSHILLAVAVAIISAPEPTLPQIVGGSIVRREALDSIPQHLTEIGWDTDVPSLFVIRFQPEKMNFQPSWWLGDRAEFEAIRIHGASDGRPLAAHFHEQCVSCHSFARGHAALSGSGAKRGCGAYSAAN